MIRRAAFIFIAKPVIVKVRRHDQNNCGNKKIQLVLVKNLFGDQQ